MEEISTEREGGVEGEVDQENEGEGVHVERREIGL
jgi:hypothetical protein